MYNLRTELIKSVMNGLKIDSNPFNQEAIKVLINHIDDSDLKGFYVELFGEQHSYLNGMDRIVKVASQYESEVDEATILEARRLIKLVMSISGQVYRDSQERNTQFSELMKIIKLDAMMPDSDFAILSTVKPHRDAKLLICEINTYQDGNIQLQAFIDALKYAPSDAIQIANPIQNLRIKR